MLPVAELGISVPLLATAEVGDEDVALLTLPPFAGIVMVVVTPMVVWVLIVTVLPPPPL